MWEHVGVSDVCLLALVLRYLQAFYLQYKNVKPDVSDRAVLTLVQ
jgi:hypothetical protein